MAATATDRATAPAAGVWRLLATRPGAAYLRQLAAADVPVERAVRAVRAALALPAPDTD